MRGSRRCHATISYNRSSNDFRTWNPSVCIETYLASGVNDCGYWTVGEFLTAEWPNGWIKEGSSLVITFYGWSDTVYITHVSTMFVTRGMLARITLSITLFQTHSFKHNLSYWSTSLHFLKPSLVYRFSRFNDFLTLRDQIPL